MVDLETFLTILYVMVDDFCQSHPTKKKPGPEASLSESEVITSLIFARWSRFVSERDFYRYAEGHLRDAFPTLPNRSQFNRLVRSNGDLIESLALHLLAALLGAQRCALMKPWTAQRCLPETLKAPGGHGWLAGRTDVDWSNSLGWYEGFRLLVAVDPTGVISGFCFGSASTADQQMAETFFAVRAYPRTPGWRA